MTKVVFVETANKTEREAMSMALNPDYSGTQEQNVFCVIDAFANARLKFSNATKGNTMREKRLYRLLESNVRTTEKNLEKTVTLYCLEHASLDGLIKKLNQKKKENALALSQHPERLRHKFYMQACDAALKCIKNFNHDKQ